jgi:hypothetical protein
MPANITAVDVAADESISTIIVENTAKPIGFMLAHHPGALGIYLMFVAFVAACAHAGKEPLAEFLALDDFLAGVPPAPTKTRQ